MDNEINLNFSSAGKIVSKDIDKIDYQHLLNILKDYIKNYDRPSDAFDIF